MVRNANYYNKLLKTINRKIRLAEEDLEKALAAMRALTLDGFELGPLSAKAVKRTLVRKRKVLWALILVRRNIKRNALAAKRLDDKET